MLARPTGRRTYPLLSLGLVTFGLAVVIWAARGAQVSLVGLLATSLIDAVPLMFGSLSGIMCERSGVVNIAIEGQFLAGAFLGAMIGSYSGNLWLGMLAGAGAGALMGALLAFLALRYQADQVIVGVVIVAFATGLTNYLTAQVLNNHQSSLNSPSVFQPIAVPGLDRIPLLGPILFDQNVFLYLALALLIIIQVGLSATRWGLRVRAVGEHPEAAETVGISVLSVRYRNVILGGAIGGLGGASFTIGSTGQFAKGMTAGLGYVALAAVIFGGWRPLGAAGAALLFGFSQSLQSTLGLLNTPIPSSFLLMLPYVITIVAVAGLVGRVRPPAASGKPYQRD
jgi:simple sugar transport system permease protein